ncbi:MAG: acyl-CoA thioesterase [Silicimonas sp.]|nr:acyl-CoA thioesterase [Silicimonas sp.]
MYPYIRSIHALIRARSMPKMGPFGTHVSHHRAWPWDTDMFGELNNGRILTLFEFGRWQTTVRMGYLKRLLKGGYSFAVAGISIRYRKRIPTFQRYRMQTRMLGYDGRFFYVEQSMWQGETCMNQMVMRAATRQGGKTILPPDFLAAMGLPVEAPELPHWVQAWIEADGTRPWPPEQGPVLTN